MLNRRVIPTLLLKGTGLVKTHAFRDPIYVGDPLNTVSLFSQKMADELILLDICASSEGRGPNFSLIERIAAQCFMPMAYGGGISDFSQVEKLFALGVEKVVINTSALERSNLISDIAGTFGKQSVVVALDLVIADRCRQVRRPCDGELLNLTPEDHLDWAVEAGAGEVLVQDVSRDGTRLGYDIDLFKKFSDRLEVPLIALGGARDAEDLARVIEEGGASAAAAGSLFVFAGRRRAVLISMPVVPEPDDGWTDLRPALAAVPSRRLATPNLARRICNLTVLDDTDPDFRVDASGVSVLAQEGLKLLGEKRLTGASGQRAIEEVVERLKVEGRGRDYDCLIGLSGGVDSSYVAMMVKSLGLRPLAFHLDNGWNSNTAVLNIKKIVDILDIDLHTYVIEWEDMKDLQRSFFRASLPDVEVLTDHAIVASTFRVAEEFGVRTVIFGINPTTESLMPRAWTYSKRDAAHIRAVHRRFGERRLTNFPFIEPWDFMRHKWMKTIKYEPLLSYLDFNKQKALNELKEKVGYEPYARKHGESRFTQFFQEYYLPEKFGFDKRKGHLSSLIIAGQMTREEALAELQQPLYPDPLQEHRDIEYVRTKLGFSQSEWDEIMAARPADHNDYPGYYAYLTGIRRMRERVRFWARRSE
jgi:imidazoleglycerol phosphate synthase cyclase subunit